MRNGILADTLRRTMPEYRMVFGLNLPQIVEIAAETGPSLDLARELWADRRTRESLLMAPMVYPRDKVDFDTADSMICDVITPEVADILCHRLLRHLPFARELAMRHITSASDLRRYTAFRLLFNLLPEGAGEIKPFAEAEFAASCPVTRSITRTLLDEINFLTDGEE